jgi:hypothetical protein
MHDLKLERESKRNNTIIKEIKQLDAGACIVA